MVLQSVATDRQIEQEDQKNRMPTEKVLSEPLINMAICLYDQFTKITQRKDNFGK